MESASLSENIIEFTPNYPNQCRFCTEPTNVPAWGKKILEHLIITIDEMGHVHVHGPLTSAARMRVMLDAAEEEMKKNAPSA